jgi:hypothetical protein
MKRFAFAMTSMLAMGAFAIDAADAQVRRGGVRGDNGAAAGQVHDREGPNGGRVVGGRGIVTDGQGNAAATSANCVSGQSVAGCRAGATTRSADGSMSHQSGLQASGANGGTLDSSGGFTRSADGTIDQGRTTTASGQSGTVTVDGAYTSDAGRSRTVTCTDASGAVIACPTR